MLHLRQRVLTLAGAAIISAGLTACVVSAEPAGTTQPAPAVTVATDYYTPMYHDGYVVYYSEAGLPFYYLNGGVVWIPSTHPFYGRYVGYYGRHRTHYWRWNRARGQRYRSYRRRGSSTRRHHHRSRDHRRGGGGGGGRGGGTGGRR